ncbi:MAG: hypothetical protein GY862_14265 [Gammaproteobacteria bacterium]|nr:hypothetical protein [Gammaproteobacteria bacterium]
MNRIRLLPVLLLVLWTASVSAGLIVRDLTGTTPRVLAEKLAGSGLKISNVSYRGAKAAAGVFSGGDHIIGFDSGIVLGSGHVSDVVGPNKNAATGYDNGTQGDAALADIAGFESHDAAILEFDFIPDKDAVTFQYVFASDEYNEYANKTVNDVFAFFVNGVNCAVNKGVPVSINTINGGNPLGKNAKKPELYKNNEKGGENLDTEMDGLTVVLTCAVAVMPGKRNHVKIAISDAGDNSYDSNVFLAAESLTSRSLTEIQPLTDDPTAALIVPAPTQPVNSTVELAPVLSLQLDHIQVHAGSGSKGRLDFSSVKITGAPEIKISTDFNKKGSVVEIDMGNGWIALNNNPKTFTLNEAALKNREVQVRTDNCAEGVSALESFQILIEGIGSHDQPVKALAPFSVNIIEKTWLQCWWRVIAIAIAILFAAILIHGYSHPSRFSSRLGVMLSPEEDIAEGFFHPVHAQRGTRGGFYRDARVYVCQDFKLSGKAAGAVARLRAHVKQVRMQAMAGNCLWRQTADGAWEEVPSGETTARPGIVYKNDAGTLFFELRNG